MEHAKKQMTMTGPKAQTCGHAMNRTGRQKMERFEHAKGQLMAYAPELVERMETWPFHHAGFDYHKKVLIASAWLLDAHMYFMFVDIVHAKARSDMSYKISYGLPSSLTVGVEFMHSARKAGLEFLNECAVAGEAWLSDCKDDVRIACSLSGRAGHPVRYLDAGPFRNVHPCLIRILERLMRSPFVGADPSGPGTRSGEDDAEATSAVRVRLPWSDHSITIFHLWQNDSIRYMLYVHWGWGVVASLARSSVEDMLELLESMADGGDVAARMTRYDETLRTESARMFHLCSAAEQRLCPREDEKNVKLSLCSGCKIVFYCSVECQRAHRVYHKPFCFSQRK